MQIQVNSDHHITGDERLTEIVQSLLQDAVGRFADRITRIEVHLNDVNGAKRGDRDKRCMMEARIGGLSPLAVTDEAGTLEEAMEGAADKLERAIERALGRVGETPGPAPLPEQIAEVEDLQELEEEEKRRKH